MNKIGDLEVWWIPNPPRKSFRFAVKNSIQAIVALNALADYDLALGEIVSCNAGGLEEYVNEDEYEWTEWYHHEEGYDIREYEDMLEEAGSKIPKTANFVPELIRKYQGFLVYNGIL